MKILVNAFLLVIIISCSSGKENLTVGNKAPDFTLQDSRGNNYKLSDYIGKSPVIVYFYPKANTPGCTREACGIRDNFSKFQETGIQVFGVSTDSKSAIKEFISDYNLNFTLLSDENKEVSKIYGVLNDSGKASRVTFIIDKNGNLFQILNDVNVETHADQVFEIAKKLL